jgi:hypothetical protein
MSRAWWLNRELVTSGLVAGEVGELPVLGNLVPSRLEQSGAVWSTEGARESGSGASCRPPQSMLIGANTCAHGRIRTCAPASGGRNPLSGRTAKGALTREPPVG